MSSVNNNQSWRFLTNHTQVLLAIARNPDLRMREIAEFVGITERAAQRIVRDLSEANYLQSSRVGRRNHYSVNGKIEMRHPAQEGQQIGELLELLQNH
jgi:DNA-binding MarR family transcriptional regulator